MSKATRNIKFRLYPSASQTRTLLDWLDLHRELYNAALEERRDAYHRSAITLTYNQQQNELPAVKAVRPDLIPLGSHALQETVRRVDRAYKAFFRRIKAGEKPGFPRFKWGWPRPGGSRPRCGGTGSPALRSTKPPPCVSMVVGSSFKGD